MERGLLTIVPANTAGQIAEARRLMLQYYETPGVAECVVGFKDEVARLPGRYARELGGALLLAMQDNSACGCGAFRKLDETTCEMKRLFVDPSIRAKGAGRMLASALIDQARGHGYQRMRLDTLPSMLSAIRLYESLGFRRIGRYYAEAPPDAMFYELSLSPLL